MESRLEEHSQIGEDNGLDVLEYYSQVALRGSPDGYLQLVLCQNILSCSLPKTERTLNIVCLAA